MNNANPTGGGNPQQAGGNPQQAGQQPAGQPIYRGNPYQGRATRGAFMDVQDPANQVGNYIPGGNNQPLLHSIRLNLEHQARLGNKTLSSKMFGPGIERFMLACIQDRNPAIYANIMGLGESYSASHNAPKW